MPLPGIAGVIGAALNAIWGVYAASPGDHIASLIDRGSGVTPRYWRLHLVAEHPVGTVQPAILIESSDSLAGPWTEQDVIDVSAGQLAGGPGLLVSYAGGVLLALIEEHTTSVQPVATVALDPDNGGGGGTTTVATVPTVYSVPATDPAPSSPIRVGVEWLDSNGEQLVTVFDCTDMPTASLIVDALSECSNALVLRWWAGLRHDDHPRSGGSPFTNPLASVQEGVLLVFDAPVAGVSEQVSVFVPAVDATLLTASEHTLAAGNATVLALISACTGTTGLVAEPGSVATTYLSGVRQPATKIRFQPES